MMDRIAPTLPPEAFEAVVNSLAETLVREYRERWSPRGAESSTRSTASAVAVSPAWLKIADAANRAQCSEAIVDFKSTDRAQAEDVTRDQLHVYAVGYQELTGKNADLIEVLNLDEKGKTT